MSLDPKALVTNFLLIRFGELVIVPPTDARRSHSGLLGPERDLMGMQIVEV